ncbi:BNR-4 repeat-containing protein [Wenyingzhuangia sp. chi5]|uniref:BNR-4 repeat-containing protein n=1 Tax=Wenyingzhuangia gilva TaxID=3057677 RepID=A0ABT8VTS8_9FLAO|nr:BNR-4 repeat-containing protein [Wenyingzhuangia sp. chi5]MDO3695335.1 BNR-4 repeat-containing protein [Wenyingzhuangia sp. chi5]
MKNIFTIVFTILFGVQGYSQKTPKTITEEGAWCWFADPRAISYKNNSGTIDATYVGYIDVHGSIKATQINHLTHTTKEVLIRSYFQPDDHNNPTFLVLPDERVMVFYSRHTDESCFYYRVSKKPGDITSLGKEFRLETKNNTTYPSPFILSDDPEHIYLCWRGINWHPTIARLTIPDKEDNVQFDWGPYQMIKSLNGKGGVRPYAKYISNGKDKIYVAYTTNHPDNGEVNYIYFNYFDVNTKSLNDIKDTYLSKVEEGAFSVDLSEEYQKEYPLTIVDDTKNRNWLWEVSMDEQGYPIIATVRINKNKTSHDYFHSRWNGTAWQQTFLTNAAGHFHQSPNIEKCYSAGMAIDKSNPFVIYASEPIEGKFGKKYELMKYTVSKEGSIASKEQLTFNSEKNNSRPFAIDNQQKDLQLVWMYGDYYDWMVSKTRPQGYPTAIRTFMEVPSQKLDLDKGLIKTSETAKKLKFKKLKSFTIALEINMNKEAYSGEIFKTNAFSFAVTERDLPKPYFLIDEDKKVSENVFGSSDTWQQKNRSTSGQWYTPSKYGELKLVVTYNNGKLTSYINGLIDQVIEVKKLKIKDLSFDDFKGTISGVKVYKRALSQDEIKNF